ncbi:MAG: hypothetical protein OEW41_02865 [Actinomycetota bacterium]|nr:hypothetical protein [Actinomycetota bacterium]
MNLKKFVVTAAAAALAVTALAAVPASATGVGNEGCTPGYWKNHTDNWEEAQPTALLSSIYTQARANVAGKTLEQALDGGGGPGADGAAVILARAATAAWLNAAHDGLGYPWQRLSANAGNPPLVATVNAAFASGSRSTMLALATQLDNDNNLGCPLN